MWRCGGAGKLVLFGQGKKGFAGGNAEAACGQKRALFSAQGGKAAAKGAMEDLAQRFGGEFGALWQARLVVGQDKAQDALAVGPGAGSQGAAEAVGQACCAASVKCVLCPKGLGLRGGNAGRQDGPKAGFGRTERNFAARVGARLWAAADLQAKLREALGKGMRAHGYILLFRAAKAISGAQAFTMPWRGRGRGCMRVQGWERAGPGGSIPKGSALRAARLGG